MYNLRRTVTYNYSRYADFLIFLLKRSFHKSIKQAQFSSRIHWKGKNRRHSDMLMVEFVCWQMIKYWKINFTAEWVDIFFCKFIVYYGCRKNQRWYQICSFTIHKIKYVTTWTWTDREVWVSIDMYFINKLIYWRDFCYHFLDFFFIYTFMF